MNGNGKELRLHMNALERMVNLRGGLQSLGWNGVLSMFIGWFVNSVNRHISETNYSS